MARPAVAPSSPRSRWIGRARRLARAAAWVALVGVTGVLLRAEVRPPDLPEGVEGFTDIVYRRDGDRRVRLDLYRPSGPAPAGGRPAVVAIHGGGWRGGSKGPYGREVARMARHGYAVVSVDYLLSRPGAPSWPANLEDVREAVRWVRRHAAEYGIDPERIAALGASAGGHLAALLGADPGDASARVAAVVDFYGPADLRAIVRESEGAVGPVELMLGGPAGADPARAEAASPVARVSAATPPMLILHGSDDRLVPPSQSEALARALGRAGVAHRLIVLDGARHGFGLRAPGRDLLPEILAFLDGVWNSRGRELPARSADRPSSHPSVRRSIPTASIGPSASSCPS